MGTPEVLIVGAGPTGLVLALWLSRMGIAVRIIDKSGGPGETSRAIAVHARTLEFHRQVGLADEVVAGGIKVEDLTFRRRGRTIARARFGRVGQDLSPFPFVLAYPQDEHERVLVEHLERAGVQVERNTELVGFVQEEDKVRATLRSEDRVETVEVPYLCGCDGARSTVRHALGADFPGGTYSQVFFVADVMATGEVSHHGITMCVSRNEFCLVIPIRASGSIRLIGIVPPEHEQKEQIRFEDISASAARNTGLAIESVNWFSTYHVHHRLVDHFRRGRAFLLGDAAHIHSPAGGQGMNTGIGDAVNLSWKLAAVLRGCAPPELLDTYELERIAFARRLIATTDRLFQFMANRSWPGIIWRVAILPYWMALVFRFDWVRRLMFKAVSQIEIKYRESPISAGEAGKVRGGDRLPWVETSWGDNFEPLAALDWQIHIYGEARDSLREIAAARGLPLHAFPWSKAAEAAGLARDALYLIRPDGHVAFANADQDAGELERFLSARGLSSFASARDGVQSPGRA